MKTRVLKYNVVIRKDDKNFIADVPTLGISDFGTTILRAKENVKQAMICHLEGLVKTGTEIPGPDTEDFYISQAEIRYPTM